MTATFTRAPAFKKAFYDVTVALFEGSDVHVSYGNPDADLDEIVAIGSVRSKQEPATLGPNRPREEDLELAVYVGVASGGRGSDVEIYCANRAYEILGLIERQMRITDTTVDGTVRQCFMTSHETDGITPPEVEHIGTLAELDATFSAAVRVTD